MSHIKGGSIQRLLARRWPLVLVASLAVFTVACSDGSAQVDVGDGDGNGDLTNGAVFAMSNARDSNEVVAYSRAEDGSLTQVGLFPTGGTGSGSFEDTSNGLVLGTAAGEIAPNNLLEPSGDQQFLFATNAGSNNITVFRVNAGGLQTVATEDSGGEKPVSITVNSGVVYVLNSGEMNDSLFDGNGNVIPNCTTGLTPTITGFTLAGDGTLTPIPGSERDLSGEQISGCAQVSFTPDGERLVVTERLAQPDALNQQTSDNERLDDEGVIITFAVNADGSLDNQQIIDATGQGPFGFTFAKNGNLFTTEQFDGPAGPGRGATTSYVPGTASDQPLLRAAPSIRNGGTDTCWVVVTDDQTLGFTTSFFADGRLSSYAIDDIGITRLIRRVATGEDAQNDDVDMGASDLALSRDSAYLYQLNSVNGTINAWRNNGDGSLELIEQKTPFPQVEFGPGGGEAGPIGLSAS